MLIHIPARIKTALLLFVLAMLVFAPITYYHSYNKVASDFDHHIEFALALAKDGPQGIPTWVLAHSAWQVILVVVRRVLHSSFELASFWAALFSVGLTISILFFWYQSALSKLNWQDWKICLLVLGVYLAAPVSLLWHLDHRMYWGYIGMASYHNPTMILLKPFAIVQFVFACQCFRETASIKNWHIVLVALLSLFGTFVKPSLAICLLPALTIFSIYRIAKHEHLNYKGLIFGLGLPMVAVLAWQFALTYRAEDAGAVAFLPFVVMGEFSQYLEWKFLLSILFPLALLVLYFKAIIQDVRMIVAWLAFLGGLVFTYLFAESGPRLLHGNFGWSGEITLLLLFAVSTLFFGEISAKPTRSTRFLAVVWSLHVAWGILYYLYNIFYKTYS
ncbi:MAG TPA: hypothetical protein VKP08_03605 [Anaerolineales bacterium]|nr:hypothetical protein [Anaerolineales bacterium]